MAVSVIHRDGFSIFNRITVIDRSEQNTVFVLFRFNKSFLILMLKTNHIDSLSKGKSSRLSVLTDGVVEYIQHRMNVSPKRNVTWLVLEVLQKNEDNLLDRGFNFSGNVNLQNYRT